jgi:hypothetical protein
MAKLRTDLTEVHGKLVHAKVDDRAFVRIIGERFVQVMAILGP